MTSSIPPEPPQSSRHRTLGFKEFVGVFVAFTTIGTILFWSLTHQDEGLDPLAIQLPLASSTPASPPVSTPTPEPSPTQVGPEAVGPKTVGPEAVGSEVGARTVGPKTVGTIQFSDVPEDYWAYPFITALAERGAVSGFRDGTFQPNKPVTRAEYATMLQEAFDKKNPVQPIESFTDVPPDYWAASAIGEANRKGFLKGYPNQAYQPNQEIPRVQAIVALTNGLGLKHKASPEDVLQTYQDANQLPDYATGPVAAATETKLVVSHPDSEILSPNQVATRADVAAFIYQALVNQGQAKQVDSEYIVQPQ